MVSLKARSQVSITGVSAAEIANSPFHNNSLPTTPLFGTDGIRGKVGELLNAPLALQVGFWTGIILRAYAVQVGPVIVGQDSRNSSHMLAAALSAGLTASGLEVWHLGLCPTPGIAYLVSTTDAIGGVMISASHNPPEDNGIKIFGSDGMKLPQLLQAEIEAGLRGEVLINTSIARSNSYGKHYFRPDLIAFYAEYLQQSLQGSQNLSGKKIVLDLAWGAAVELAPLVFAQMGAEVVSLHSQADGDRINVNCGSTALDILQASVLEHQADIGFAFDGDADRLLAVDNQGRQINGDYILYLWGRHLQQHQLLPDNLIISTVMANLGFELAWQQLGGKLTRTAVGDQYVQAEMLRTGCMLGGEQSGHILCRHYGISGDGILTALHLASVVQQAQVPLSEMVEQSFQTYPQLLRNVRVLDRDRRLEWKNCQPLQQAIALAETAMANQGRVLVRASGTEPVIRVMVEAIDAELANHWSNILVAEVHQHLG